MTELGAAKLVEAAIEYAFRNAAKGRKTALAKQFIDSRMVGMWCAVMDFEHERLIKEINKYG